MRLSIGEAADRLGVSVRTLRWYDEIGLVKPAAVGENGYRYYGREEMALLQQAVFYKELGLPLKEIKPLLQAPEDTRRRALLAHKELLKLKKQQLQQLNQQKLKLKTNFYREREHLFTALTKAVFFVIIY